MLDVELDRFMVYLCRRCGNVATLRFQLENYVIVHSCGECEQNMKRMYGREISGIVKL